MVEGSNVYLKNAELPTRRTTALRAEQAVLLCISTVLGISYVNTSAAPDLSGRVGVVIGSLIGAVLVIEAYFAPVTVGLRRGVRPVWPVALLIIFLPFPGWLIAWYLVLRNQQAGTVVQLASSDSGGRRGRLLKVGVASSAVVLVVAGVLAVAAFRSSPPAFPQARETLCAKPAKTAVNHWCLEERARRVTTTLSVWSLPAVETGATGYWARADNGEQYAVGASCKNPAALQGSLVIPIDFSERWYTSGPTAIYPNIHANFFSPGFIYTNPEGGSSPVTAYFETVYSDGSVRCVDGVRSSNLAQAQWRHPQGSPSRAALADPSYDRHRFGYLIVAGWQGNRWKPYVSKHFALTVPVDQSFYSSFDSLFGNPMHTDYKIKAATGEGLKVIKRRNRVVALQLQLTRSVTNDHRSVSA